MRTLYSIDEVVLIPATVSEISSRSECNPYYKGKLPPYKDKLPLFIAPMSCLTNKDNYQKFEDLGFNAIVPRTEPWEVRKKLLLEGVWVAVGLEEGFELTERSDYSPLHIRVCIDIANGHQKRAFELCGALKSLYPNSEVMVGNIANPKTYAEYAKWGADYVRVGIGSGQVCTTSVQTGIHYPMASLIQDCYLMRHIAYNRSDWKAVPKIVADGGFGYIDQIVKALALGADYVMIGKIAASFPEACGTVMYDGTREYYGMSTEKAQRLMHPDRTPKHSEGTVRYVNIRENTQNWIDDFTHALKSSMSYCNARNLGEYKGKVEFGIQNPTTFNAYIKS